jgi:hypothetical protein
MTISKSQGQSLQAVGVYLPKPVFSHGHLYVALSRSGNPAQTKILINSERNVHGFFDGQLQTGVFAKNIIFR